MTAPDTAPPPALPGAPDLPPKSRRTSWDVVVRYQGVVVPLVALGVAFGVGAILIRLQGVNPGYAYTSLFTAALGSPEGLLRTLQKATPLVLAGLAVAVALRAGLFNIGAQGQLLFGSVTAAWVGYRFGDLPMPVLVPLCLAAGVLAGGAWAAIAGLLKATRGVHEVISTIMLNSIAAGIIDYLISHPLKQPGQPIPRTPPVSESARLSELGFLPVGFVVAVLLALAVAWVMRNTTLGFRFDTVGANRFAAEYAGMRIPVVITAAMTLSGALAGLGGAIETIGVSHRFESGLSAGLGFDGITIALLARANPIATIPAALLVGVLRSGAPSLQFDTGIQPEVVDMLLAVTLLLVSIPVLAKLIFRRRAAAGVSVTSGWGS